PPAAPARAPPGHPPDAAGAPEGPPPLGSHEGGLLEPRPSDAAEAAPEERAPGGRGRLGAVPRGVGEGEGIGLRGVVLRGAHRGGQRSGGGGGGGFRWTSAVRRATSSASRCVSAAS